MGWKDQFEKSMAGRENPPDWPRYSFRVNESFTRVIGTLFQEEWWGAYPSDSEEIAHAAMRPLAVLALDRLLNDLSQVNKGTFRDDPYNSPIETAMLFALLILGQVRFGPVAFGDEEERHYYTDIYGGYKLNVQSQVPIGDYRVDFLLTLRFVDWDYGKDERTGEYQQRHRSKLSKSMVVECDGHEFHASSKKQIIRDRKRDRALQALGLPVFRYTGADIWQDVFRCAAEALTALEDLLDKASPDPKRMEIWKRNMMDW
jgi:very-short-patch-repair endonuclease